MPDYEKKNSRLISKDDTKLSKIKEQAQTLLESVELQSIMDSVPNPFMILNSRRQIIFANNKVAEFLKL